jgi:hypothetical protein
MRLDMIVKYPLMKIAGANAAWSTATSNYLT